MRIKSPLSSLLRRSNAEYVRLQFSRYYKRAKYVNKTDAIKRLSRRRFTARELSLFVRRVKEKLRRDERRKIRGTGKNKPVIVFKWGYETKNFDYYKTAWIIPRGMERLVWDVYGEPMQDFVEKNTRARFIGIEYKSLQYIGDEVIEQPLRLYSQRFTYDEFFRPEDLPTVGIWLKFHLGVNLQRKLRSDSLQGDDFQILTLIIAVEKL